MHKIKSFHLRYDIWYDLFQTCYYIGKMLSSKYKHINVSIWMRKEKKTTQVVNQFLLLIVTYHISVSIDISFSLFILLVLLHYILVLGGWGVFSEVVI